MENNKKKTIGEFETLTKVSGKSPGQPKAAVKLKMTVVFPSVVAITIDNL